MDESHLATVGIIGRTRINDTERNLLTNLGRAIAKANKTLVAVPAAGSVKAVREGVQAEGGQERLLERGTLTESAHVIVYADERLERRLREAQPDLATSTSVTILRSPRDLDLFLCGAQIVLHERGIDFQLTR